MADIAPDRWPLRRSNGSARLLVQFGVERGIGLTQLLAGTTLTPSMLSTAHEEIDAAAELALMRNLVRGLAGVAGLGVLVGQAYHLTAYGIWGFALISSQTTRKAVELGLRYVDLTFAFTRITLEENGPEARLIIDGSALDDDVRSFLVERDLAAALVALREGANPAPRILHVGFTHGEPSNLSAYRTCFGIAPTFNTSESYFSFPSAFLDHPRPETDEGIARACEDECRELLLRRRSTIGFASKIRDRLLADPKTSDIETIARSSNLTSRTIRRQLEAEGTSFRELQNEVRRVLAEELLASKALSVGDIADRLGYSDASNFVHAFRRWTGITPAAFSLRSSEAKRLGA